MKVKILPVSDGVLQISETEETGHAADAYLVLGEKKAALIDAGENNEYLYENVRQITSLPVTVLITHGHRDHAGKGLMKFFEHGDEIYMSHKDIPLLEEAGSPYADKIFRDLADGMRFDLGGRMLEAKALPGHTPGSYIFLDRAHHELFSGDALGSGHFWMQLPHCLPLHEFLPHAERLYEELKDTGVNIYPGHRYQSPVQLTETYIADTAEATRQILEGKQDGELKTMVLGKETLYFKEASWGTMVNYVYNPDNL